MNSRFINIARHTAENSDFRSFRLAAIIFSNHKNIIATGYNYYTTKRQYDGINNEDHKWYYLK